MNRSLTLLTVLGCLGIVVTGCARKSPATSPVVEPPTSVSQAPATARPDGDATEPGLPTELQELNAELARRGLLGDVFFALDDFRLDEAARERLARNATFLKAHPEYLLAIEGHCDERGTNEYNLALGEHRANGTLAYLQSLSLPATRFRTVSYGEERPQCTVPAESCWAINRRAHFVVTGRTGGS